MNVAQPTCGIPRCDLALKKMEPRFLAAINEALEALNDDFVAIAITASMIDCFGVVGCFAGCNGEDYWFSIRSGGTQYGECQNLCDTAKDE